jgi:hypothetical protein
LNKRSGLAFAAGGLLLAGGSAVYAHGETVGTETVGFAWHTWVLLVLSAVTAAFTLWYWLRRKRPEGRALKLAALWFGTGAVLMGAFNSAGMWEKKEEAASINLIHIHGLAYSQNGDKVMVATHDGIKAYEGGHWHLGEGEGHDYMGYAPFEGGFYSSGHPKSGSSLQNPLGLIKSSDEGRTIEILALHGKVDFHLMAASYKNRVLYAVNPEPNEELKQPGLYMTKDEGRTWTRAAMNGFQGEATAIAAHPDLAEIVALGTRDALYLSTDSGKTFNKLLSDSGISALSFDRDGMLTVGTFKDKPALLQLDPASHKQQKVPLPDLKEDAIAYTVHHPVNRQERIITTYEQDVYVTTDGGETWSQLADNGKTKAAPAVYPKAGDQSS